MPRLVALEKPLMDLSPRGLCNWGIARITEFARVNGIECPLVKVTPPEKWYVNACAYYRPETVGNRVYTSSGINICLERCARPATGPQLRNWNWPGATTDREPAGVICHEMGHHLDWWASERKGTYFGDYSEKVVKESGEKPITTYCPNPAEVFAEWVRLFLTNQALFFLLRPQAWDILCRRWTPVGSNDWREELGPDVPSRILANLERKVREAS